MARTQDNRGWRSPEVTAWDDDCPTIDDFLSHTDLSAFGRQLPPASANHRPRRVSPLPPVNPSPPKIPHAKGRPITYKDRFKVGLDHRKMITSKADDRWMNRLLADADAAVEMLPPAAVAPGHVDARRLRIFSDAFDVFISRQHQLSDLCTLIKTEYETYLKGPTQRRLDPLDSPDSGGGDTVADSRELRAEIATLQARVQSLRAEATAAESDRERAVAEVKAAAPPFAQAGPAAAEQVGVAAESSTKERGGTKAELGPDCGPIGAMVREMASMEEEIAALEAEQSATGVPTRVLGWLDSNLNDVNKEIRLVQKQIEVLESQWFAGELDKLNRPPRVYSVGEGFEETTWFSAPPYS